MVLPERQTDAEGNEVELSKVWVCSPEYAVAMGVVPNLQAHGSPFAQPDVDTAPEVEPICSRSCTGVLPEEKGVTAYQEGLDLAVVGLGQEVIGHIG